MARPRGFESCQSCQGDGEQITPVRSGAREGLSRMLQSGFTSVLKSRNRDELQDEVVGFTRRLGFETVSATVVIDHLLGEAEFITVDNTPRAYRELFQNRENWPARPVMQHCNASACRGSGISRRMHARPRREGEEQARFGYRHASPWRCTCRRAATSSSRRPRPAGPARRGRDQRAWSRTCSLCRACPGRALRS